MNFPTRIPEAPIAFNLGIAPEEGNCRLRIDLVDAHFASPPLLHIHVNETLFQHAVSKGQGDASIYGDPARGAEQIVDVEFPASLLKVGHNEISITTHAGSWILYDAIQLEAPPSATLTPGADRTVMASFETPAVLLGEENALTQPIHISVRHFGEPAEGTVEVSGLPAMPVSLKTGAQVIQYAVPAVEEETSLTVSLHVDGQEPDRRDVTVRPVRPWTVYLLHHTHLDIGYTHLQSDVEKNQWAHMDYALELAEKTADYPEGSRFKWLPEGLWAVESYLEQATPEKCDAFLAAVREGRFGLDALYGNQLTALSRPEELLELTRYARDLATKHDLTIDTAMITDVPGYTWGMVPVLAQSGVKYFNIGPNAGHRIGYTLSEWGDKPFYWVSPSGQDKVLCWVAGKAYSWFHRGPIVEDSGMLNYLRELDQGGYPYDMVHVRYSIGGDNGPPDPNLPDFVRGWNERYTYPKLVIATSSEMFHAFEDKYADVIPEFSGDFTPYWEDGAGSSARETALARAAAERLVQAQTLWTMASPGTYPREAFEKAWREVLLYNEHTWGAHNSISEPESAFALGQWAVKQAFALEADRQSRELLDGALEPSAASASNVSEVLVHNTSSWTRSDLVELPTEWGCPGDRVETADGSPVPSQRLASGALAFVASDVPPMGAARYVIRAGEPHPPHGEASAQGTELSGDGLRLVVDDTTGSITTLEQNNGPNLVNDAGLNDYLYVEGRSPENPQRNGNVTLRPKEAGPLVASIEITSEAPGCNTLTREIRLVHGLGYIEIMNTVDKQNIHSPEGVHFAYPFNVPGGVMRMDTPWAVVRPETDQLPGSCKNYFTVQRWVDVSNDDYGVTWATLDAPLVEVGAITTDAVAVGWIKELEPTTTFYSFVMNNYWETNYKAGQEGPTVFRYALQPHGPYDQAAAQRFGIERSQPLIVVPAGKATPHSMLAVEPAAVTVTSVTPSKDGKARMIRLYNGTSQPVEATLDWGEGKPARVLRSDLWERPGKEVPKAIPMGAYEILTLRMETL
jgi:alpha-mannosidase